MKMMPPPIITIMKIDITIDPGSRYWMYGHVGIQLDDVERAVRERALVAAASVVQAATSPPIDAGHRRRDEVVGVVLDDREPRLAIAPATRRE